MRSLITGLLLPRPRPRCRQRGAGWCWARRVARADAARWPAAGRRRHLSWPRGFGTHQRPYPTGQALQNTPVRGISTIKRLLLLTFLRQSSVRHRPLTSAEQQPPTGSSGTPYGCCQHHDQPPRRDEDRGRGTADRDALVQLIHGFSGSPPPARATRRCSSSRTSTRPSKRHRTFARRLFVHRRGRAEAAGRRARRGVHRRCSRAAGATAPARPDHQPRAARLEHGLDDARARHHDVGSNGHRVRRHHDRGASPRRCCDRSPRPSLESAGDEQAGRLGEGRVAGARGGRTQHGALRFRRRCPRTAAPSAPTGRPRQERQHPAAAPPRPAR